MEQRPSSSSSVSGLLYNTQQNPSPSPSPSLSTALDFDEAFKFLQVASVTTLYQSRRVTDIKEVERKVDWRILPILCSCLLIQCLDKIVFQSLVHTGKILEAPVTEEGDIQLWRIYFAAATAGSLLSAITLTKVRAAVWLAANLFAWSISIGCVAITESYTGLLACRAAAGLLQGATLPCLTMMISSWYRKREQPLRFCISMGATGIAHIAGPLISSCFDQADNLVLPIWRIVYISLGSLGIILSFVILQALPNDPISAAGDFLSIQEVSILLNFVSTNRTTVRNSTFTRSHLTAALLDPQVYLLIALACSTGLAAGIVQFTTAKVIQESNMHDVRAMALVSCTGISSIVITFLTGLILQYTYIAKSTALIAVILTTTVGGSILACVGFFTQSSNRHSNIVQALPYIVISLGNIATPAIALLLFFASANISGSTKRTVAISLITAAYPLGHVLSSLLWSGNREALSRWGYVYLVASIVTVILSLILRCWYVFENGRKVRKETALSESAREGAGAVELGKHPGDEWVNRTDQEDLTFRYEY